MNKLQRLPLGGAVDLDGKPHGIDDGSLRKQQNIIPDKDGYPGRRGSLSYVTDLVTSAFDFPIWCGAPKDNPGTIAIYGTDGNEATLYIAQIGNDTGSQQVVRTTKPLVSLPCMFSDGELTYFTVGAMDDVRLGGGQKLVKDGSTFGFSMQDFLWNDPQLLLTRPRYVTPWRDRFLYAHFEGDYRGTILISDSEDPLTVGENALTDRGVEVTGGRDITGVHEVLLAGQGSPASSIAIVMTLEKSYYMSGDLPETDESFDPNAPLGTLATNKLSSNAGCLSHHTICDTPYGTIWCGPNNIWFLPLGQTVPIPIGRRLSTLLKAQPEDQYYRIQAVYANGFYRLQLFSPGQGPTETTPHGEQWWLDLRNGPPTSWKDAMWHGPMVFHVAGAISGDRGVDTTVLGTYCMDVDTRDGQEQRLYGVHPAVTRSLAGFTLVQYDSAEPRDVAGINRTTLVHWAPTTAYAVGDEIVVDNTIYNGAHAVGTLGVWRIQSITSGSSGGAEPTWDIATSPIHDAGVRWAFYASVISPSQMIGSEVLATLETKDYTFNDLMSDKLFQGVELSYFLTMPERLTLTQIVDGGKVMDMMLKDCPAGAGPVIGAAILGQARESIEFLAVTAYSAAGTRTVGKRSQIRIEETPGILLPAGYNVVGFVYLGVEYSVTLVDSYYANLTALLTEIIATLSANPIGPLPRGLALSLDFSHTLLTLTSVDGFAWAPSIATDAIRFLWSLLGMSTWNHLSGAPALTITGDEVPYDLAIGDLALEESNMKYQQFKRRPNV